jgi:hypothetical protein
MLSVTHEYFMLSVIMVNIIKLSVVMLNVVAPFWPPQQLNWRRLEFTNNLVAILHLLNLQMAQIS